MFTGKDERVNTTLTRLYSFGFWGIFVIASLYLITMSLFIKAEYREYSFAIYLLVLMMIYVTLAPIFVGIIEEQPKPLKVILISSSVTGLVSGGLTTFNNFLTYHEAYANEHVYMLVPVLIISTISGTILSLLIISLVVLINNWRQKKIKTDLDKSEF